MVRLAPLPGHLYASGYFSTIKAWSHKKSPPFGRCSVFGRSTLRPATNTLSLLALLSANDGLCAMCRFYGEAARLRHYRRDKQRWSFSITEPCDVRKSNRSFDQNRTLVAVIEPVNHPEQKLNSEVRSVRCAGAWSINSERWARNAARVPVSSAPMSRE